MLEDDFFDEYAPLQDNINAAILMHRDAHFAGNFNIMLEYYGNDGKGVQPDLSTERIREVAEMERRAKQNLAPQILNGADAEKVGKVRAMYKNLRSLYDLKDNSNKSTLIADLILSEEPLPQKEIDAVVAAGESIVPQLIELMRTEELYDPLFPGYGMAPQLAITCLGAIGGKRALYALFESIGHGDFFEEEAVFRALEQIGAPAEKFLLQVVSSRPITDDNEKAAIALGAFKKDVKVAAACLEQLQDPAVWDDPSLACYLVYNCESLSDPTLRQQFQALSQQPTFPKLLAQDVATIAAQWSKET